MTKEQKILVSTYNNEGGADFLNSSDINLKSERLGFSILLSYCEFSSMSPLEEVGFGVEGSLTPDCYSDYFTYCLAKRYCASHLKMLTVVSLPRHER